MLDSANLATKGHSHDSSPLGSGVGRPCSYSPCFAKIKLRVVQFQSVLENDFVVVTAARDFIRLLTIELH